MRYQLALTSSYRIPIEYAAAGGQLDDEIIFDRNPHSYSQG
jgi:hypothetical protein